MALRRSGTQMRYIITKNNWGDILAIYDNTGNLVAKYVYDTWGNHKVLNPDGTENTNASFVGNINPFRYHSYYFDIETNLYYLRSRYYDPKVGRFISMDQIEYLSPKVVNGLNLYAYCINNPVMRYDPNGTFWGVLALCVLGGASLFMLTGCSATEEPEKNYHYAESEEEVVEGSVNYKIYQPEGKEPVIKIYNSFNITKDSDKREILKYIIGTPQGRQYGLSEDNIDYYVREWNVHNVAYKHPSLAQKFIDGTIEEIKLRAQNVDLNTDDDNASKYNSYGGLCGYFG